MVKTYYAWFFTINEEIEVIVVSNNEVEARLKVKEKFDECNSIKLVKMVENFIPFDDTEYKERYLDTIKDMINKLGELKNENNSNQ